MTKAVLENIKEGITRNTSVLYVKSVTPGRFHEEVDLDIYLRKNGEETHLLFVKLFDGRRPHHKPWIELFGINEHVHIGDSSIDYFNSELENGLLEFFTQFIGPGENIFVDYYRDEETKKQLEVGIPAAATRLGYKLFNLGFTWFKDWYFPEGFMEGEQKLQAEKPLNEVAKMRQLKDLHDSAKSFIENTKSIDENDLYMVNALKRTHTIIERDV